MEDVTPLKSRLNALPPHGLPGADAAALMPWMAAASTAVGFDACSHHRFDATHDDPLYIGPDDASADDTFFFSLLGGM